MRFLTLFSSALGLSLLALTGCVETRPQPESQVSEAEFREKVVGARLVWEGGETRYHPDGTFNGRSRDGALTGRWRFDDGRYCRSGSIGGRRFPDACETVVLSGDRLIFTGTGITYIYRIRR